MGSDDEEESEEESDDDDDEEEEDSDDEESDEVTKTLTAGKKVGQNCTLMISACNIV